MHLLRRRKIERRKCEASLLDVARHSTGINFSLVESRFDLSRGWFKIFCATLESLDALSWDGRIDSVSSDLGLLRIEIPDDSARDFEVWNMLGLFERAALRICEECGDSHQDPNDVERYILRDGSFINLCSYCKDYFDGRPLPRLACAFPPGYTPR